LAIGAASLHCGRWFQEFVVRRGCDGVGSKERGTESQRTKGQRGTNGVQALPVQEMF
jgi:hypothetical protein